MEKKFLKEMVKKIDEHIDNKNEKVGSAVTVVMEGTRPMMVEIQALVTESFAPMPTRDVLDPIFPTRPVVVVDNSGHAIYFNTATIKLLGWPDTGSGRVPIGTWPYWWAGVIELLVGVLLTVGLLARPVALLGAGEMAFAYISQHLPKGLLPITNGGELAVLYLLAFLLIAFAGAGAFAVARADRD